MIYFEYTDKEGRRLTFIPTTPTEPMRVARRLAQSEEVPITLKEMSSFSSSSEYDLTVGVIDRFGNIT